MALELRIILIIASAFTFLYVMRKIRKSQIQIKDSIFWILVSTLILIISIFPSIPILGAKILGFASPVNFVYLCFLFILLAKSFMNTLKISQLERKNTKIVQHLALFEKTLAEKEEKNNENT